MRLFANRLCISPFPKRSRSNKPRETNKSRPRFVSLDPSTFENPVPVGSVLFLSGSIVYTDPEEVVSSEEATATTPKTTRVLVRVDSYVRNVEHGERKPTGTFNYSFDVDGDVRIMPRTYSEFMMYIDARRRSKTLVDMDAGSLSTSLVE
jgi:acyl-coenzyme A thioesterase 9